MNVKEQLQNLSSIDNYINTLKRLLKDINDSLNRLTVTYGTDKGTSHQTDKLAELVSKKIDLEVKIKEKMLFFQHEKIQLTNYILRLKGTLYSNLLINKYLNKMPMSEIAEIEDYSVKQISRLMKKAETELENLIEDENKDE